MAANVKWDLHHHAVPEFYVEALRDAGVTAVGGFRFPRWSPERSLRAMDAMGTERAWLSVPPGVDVDGVASPVELAQRLNDAGAELVAAHGDRFGWFASLPQGDVDASLAEIERIDAREVLLMSNVRDRHFGDRALDPLWQALDARRAVVFVHPNSRPRTDDQGLLNPLYLWQNDTARTMLDFLRAGGHMRFPRITWVLAHAAGPLPVLLDEALRGLRTIRPNIDAELAAWRGQVFLDTASKAYDEQIPAILAFGGPGQVTFGSDFPWATRRAGAIIARAWARAVQRLDLDDGQLDGIFRANAVRVFQRDARPAPRSTPAELSTFTPYTAPPSGLEPLPASFWHGDRTAVQERIVLHNNGSHAQGFAVIDMLQPEFSCAELARVRQRGVEGIRIPLDFASLEGPRDFLAAKLLDALADGHETLRFEPRHPDGTPLLDDRRLDTVLFCAKGHWLGRLRNLDASRVILAGTVGVIPYLARPIDILYYLSRGKRGALAYVWATFIIRRPAGYRWLRETRRE